MTTFKPGDRIRRKLHVWNAPRGFETVVEHDYANGNSAWRDNTGALRYTLNPKNWELVSEQPAPFDATKLRKGDKVLVISTVLGDGVDEDGELFIQPGPYATLSQIIGYAPGYVPAPVEEPLAVGDKVSTNGYIGQIVFQDGGESVIRHLNGYLFIAPTADLKRVPE